MTAEVGGWSFPIDKLIEQAKNHPPRDQDDKREWIEAYLKLRFYKRFLTLYSDLARHGGVELDPATGLATVVTYNKQDADEALKYGDVRQLRAITIQAFDKAMGDAAIGEVIARHIQPPKREKPGRPPYPDRKMDAAENDYYFIRELLISTYRLPNEELMTGWLEHLTVVIAEFHDVRRESLIKRIQR